MTLKTRAGALLLAALTAFVMLFSDFFIALEAEHDCVGDNCPVCEQIAVCENTLKNLSNGTAAAVAAAVIIWAGVMLVLFFACADKIDTLVSLKVKLLN